MNKILFMLLLVLNLYAIDDSGLVLYNETIVAKDNYEQGNYLGRDKGTNETIQNIVKIKYYNYLTDDLFFNVLVSNRYTHIDEEYSKDVMNYLFDKSDTYIESLYFTYHLYDNWFISMGIFPFTNGSYSEISEFGIPKGTGIIKIIDTPLEAIFLSKRGSLYGMKTLTSFGYGKYHSALTYLSDALQDDISGTNGYYLTYDVYDGFDSFKFNLYSINYIKNDIDVGNNTVMAVAYNKYITDNGLGIYGTLAGNRIDIDMTGLSGSVPPFLLNVFPNAFDFEDAPTRYGYLYSLGLYKDIDSKIVESYNVGIEYTKTGENWTSFANNQYTDNQNYSYLHGDNLFMWATTRFTTEIALKVFYGVARQDGANVIGNSSRTVPFDETPKKSWVKHERYGFKLVFKY